MRLGSLFSGLVTDCLGAGPGVQSCTALAAEWDRARTGANLRKHGFRFVDAVTGLEDEGAISIRDEGADEERWITIGMDSAARLLVVVDTWRGEQIRLISARLATRRRTGNTRKVMKKEYDFGKGRRRAGLRVPPGKTFWICFASRLTTRAVETTRRSLMRHYVGLWGRSRNLWRAF